MASEKNTQEDRSWYGRLVQEVKAEEGETVGEEEVVGVEVSWRASIK